jgi:GNAT superfamily N-acetyltransferase
MLQFDERYHELAALRDRSRVTLRLIRPDDKDLLRRGFDRLSPESRYRRFLGAKTRLTDAELAYLTEVDGHDHFAIGATIEDAAGHEEGVGIARFIRTESDPSVAEVAVAVADDWQGKGLGTLLLLRLVAAARERGVERFSGQALASNEALRDVLDQIPRGVRVRAQEGEVTVEVDLPDIPVAGPPTPEDRATPLARLLALVARGRLLARESWQRLTTGVRGEDAEQADGPSAPDPGRSADEERTS